MTDKTCTSPEPESQRELMPNIIKELGAPILNIEIHYSESIGLYILALLNCDANQALKHWLEIVNKVRELRIPILIKWTGKVDVSPEEMGNYIGKIFARMNMFLITREPIDAAKVLKEEISSKD